MCGNRALAQEPVSVPSKDEDIKLFRKDVRSIRKQLIAANMDLTDAQAQQFWPVFDRYTAELAAIYDKKFALLKDYAQNFDALTDVGGTQAGVRPRINNVRGENGNFSTRFQAQSRRIATGLLPSI
jgi:hypothetical protein